MSESGLGGEFALIGMAESDVGIVPNKSPRELCVQVTLDAIRDAGLTLADVDGLITCNAFAEPIMYHAEAVAEYIGWQPRHCVTVNTGGGTTFMALNMAAAAIQAGMADTIVVAMADSLRSFMTREQAMVVQSSSGHPHYEQPYGPTVPAYYALIARAHMAQYGSTEAQFAEAAVSCRAWASQHPKAQMRDPITVDDVMNSRGIADPLKVLDCSLVSDGGAAVVITRKAHGMDGPHKPITLLGYGEGQPMSTSVRPKISRPQLRCSRAKPHTRRRGSPQTTSIFCSSTTALPLHSSFNWRTLGSAPRAKAATGWRAALVDLAGASRSTPTEACCPIVIPGTLARCLVLQRRSPKCAALLASDSWPISKPRYAMRRAALCQVMPP